MFQINNLINNDNIKVIDSKENIKVIEYEKDLSVVPETAIVSYFSSKMNVRKRQVVVELNNESVILSAGAMQWMAGDIKISSDIKGVGDFVGKMFKAAATNESIAKPKYSGTGTLVLEPTYKFILLEDVSDWDGGIVLDDGLFLACGSTVSQKIVSRANLSSAVLGNEGLFNLSLTGKGIAVLESEVPREELIEVVLNNDVLKIDGNNAIAWSGTLDFTVEKSTRSLIGSAVSGEGFLNVYRGTGKVLMAPTI